MSKPSEKAMQVVKQCDDEGIFNEGLSWPDFVRLAERFDAFAAEALSEHKRVLGLAESALADAQAGLDYVRQHHGDLYGVGFDRCAQNSRLALAAIAELKTNEKP